MDAASCTIVSDPGADAVSPEPEPDLDSEPQRQFPVGTRDHASDMNSHCDESGDLLSSLLAEGPVVYHGLGMCTVKPVEKVLAHWQAGNMFGMSGSAVAVSAVTFSFLCNYSRNTGL
eukprot:SAG31_NODE_21816_length_540_cov_0.823129_1_plen_117_part_00